MQPSRTVALIFTITYVATPSIFHAVTFDLRPLNLLGPMFLLTVMSVYFRRHIWEIVALFVILLSVREEALLLGIGVLGYAWFRFRHHSRRLSLIAVLSTVWVGWLLITVAYFNWTGYSMSTLGLGVWFRADWGSRQWYTLLWFSVGSLALLILHQYLKTHSAGLNQSSEQLQPIHWFQEMAGYALVFVPLGYQVVQVYLGEHAHKPQGQGLSDLVSSLFYHPKYTLYLLTFLGFLFVAHRPRRLGVITWTPLVLLLGLFLTAHAVNDEGPIAQWYHYSHQQHDARLVLDARREMDRYSTVVLVDYDTHQAFYDFQHVYVLQRLPVHFAGERRYFPDNQELVTDLLRERIRYMVYSRDGETLFADALQTVSPTPTTILVAENDGYRVIKFPR